jgi:hypothetical protein
MLGCVAIFRMHVYTDFFGNGVCKLDNKVARCVYHCVLTLGVHVFWFPHRWGCPDL